MAEGRNKPAIVLFDFDGVLFKGDSFAAFMRGRCKRQWWRVMLAAPLLLAALPFAIVRRTRRRRSRPLQICA